MILLILQFLFQDLFPIQPQTELDDLKSVRACGAQSCRRRFGRQWWFDFNKMWGQTTS